jgi:Cd2+/Zn2+-exporting ATPase
MCAEHQHPRQHQHHQHHDHGHHAQHHHHHESACSCCETPLYEGATATASVAFSAGAAGAACCAAASSTLTSATVAVDGGTADDDDDDDGAPCACCAHDSDDDADEDGSRGRRAILLLIACGVPTIVSAVLHIIGASGPILTPLATILAIIGSVVGLSIIAPAIGAAVRSRRIDINILMAIAVVGAWLLGDFVEAAAVVLFFCVGEWLEDFAIARNRSSIERLMDLTPRVVRVRRGDEVVELAPEEVALGSAVVIRPGDRIPLDGIVSAGSASVDESPITGESVPVLKQAGDALYAGSLSVDGRLELTTTATVKDSTLARIVALVEESQKKRTPYERFINRFARYYTPLIIVIAVLVALVPTLIGLLTTLDLGGIAVWGYRALTLLVIACPCALVIATPVSVVTGLSRAARMGVLVKGGAFLELSSKVRVVAFDKTGTLTYGRPAVTEVVVLPAAAAVLGSPLANSEGVLACAAALERDSTHPLARAVLAAVSDGDSIPRADSVTEMAGRGITGSVNDLALAVGSPAYAQTLTDLAPDVRERIRAIESSAATVLVVLANGTPVGLIGVKDVVREESPTLLRKLKGVHGMHTVMLTGDNATTARAIAREAGIEQVHSELLPHEKMERIEELKRTYGTVAMVGDGINDAPALALADVGVAMGAASSDTAIEVADVALMANNIEVLPAFFRLARRVVSTIHVNIVFALVVKAAVMVLAIAGIAQMWMAIFADVGVLILVLLYSMRLGLAPRRG